MASSQGSSTPASAIIPAAASPPTSSDLSGFFDVVVTGRNVRNGKLVPDIFLLAAEKIGVPPNECVVFEDSFNGIRAAHAAGAKPRLA